MSKFRSSLELHSIIGGQTIRQILVSATDVCVKEILNGQFYVTFTYPKLPEDSSRYAALREGNEIKFPDGIERGQRFIIKRADEERRGLRVYKRVEAHHVAFELNRKYYDGYIDFAAAQQPETLLALLGSGTGYTFAVGGTFPATDIFNWGEDRRHNLLQDVADVFGGELAYDNNTITLTTRAGANYGTEIRYRKNLTGISRKSHDMERITRLYGYGKNGLTIEGLPGHTVKYIDSPYFDAGHPYEGSVKFPDIGDQSELLAAMQRHLATVELPKVSYEIDFVQLEKADPTFAPEAIRSVGDTVTVIDEPMGYRFDARVTEFERYPYEPKRGRVVLANFRELSAADYVWQATVGSQRAIQFTSDNAVLKGVKYDDSITLIDGYGMRVSDDLNRTMLRIGQTAPGEYGLAMFNKSGVRTLWQEAATGNAYFAGTLQAANGSFSGSISATSGFIGGWTIGASSLSGSGTIIGGSVIGSTLTGGTITGALIQTQSSGVYPRVELSNTSNIFKVASSNTAFIEAVAYGSPTSVPSLRFENSEVAVTLTPSSNPLVGLTLNGPALHAEINRITLRGYNGVYFLNWASIRSEGSGPTPVESLQDALNKKANLTYVTSLETRIAALEA